MNPEQRKEMVMDAFVAAFGGPPSVWSRAPGRVDLMGSHTDYNQGYVLTMTIDRDTWIAARPRTDRQVVIRSLNADGGGVFSLDAIAHDAHASWTDYVRGVATVLGDAGFALTGFEGLVHSTVPFGSGLSSSAALEMATATLFSLLGGWEIDPVEMALLGQRAENQFVGVNCGILDQYSSALGKEGTALLLDCRHLSSRTAAIAPGLQPVICDTHYKRALTGSEYGERRAQCEEGARLLGVTALRDVSLEQFAAREAALPPVVARRCRFIIEENQRVLDLAAALPGGDPARLSGLMAASFAGARDLYEIAVPEMEAMMEAMLTGPGVIGARQAGAGFGGCMVALVAADQVDAFAGHVQNHYLAATGLQPRVYPVQAAQGAGPL